MKMINRGKLVTDKHFLHKVSDPVDMSNKSEVDELVNFFKEYYKSKDGAMQGISAPQLGMLKRAFLTRWRKGGDTKIFFNPMVHFKIYGVPRTERCLSEGERFFMVWRPILIFVSYDVIGDDKRHHKLFGYHKARIFMHEYDHINGVLLEDKAILKMDL